MEDFEIREDRVRMINYKNHEYKLIASDPYGFWTVHQEVGSPPEELRGMYTSHTEAEKAVKNCIDKLDFKKEKKAAHLKSFTKETAPRFRKPTEEELKDLST